ncbi:MAG: DUF998 domain-containing protein [Candidatus Thorarchaeota archaeon]
MASQSYKILSLIQAVLIGITAISVFDLGYGGHVDKGLWFNHVLFHLDSLPDFLKDSAFWGEFQFWAYCFAIVAFCQIAKVIPLESANLRKWGPVSGISAVIVLVVSVVTAIVVSLPDYNPETETLSSLVDYGWLPTVLMSWGLMVGAVLAIPFFVGVGITQHPRWLALSGAVVASFSCISLFFTGLLLPTDEPFNHGEFAYAFFLAMALAIGMFAVTVPEGSSAARGLQISGLGIFAAIYILVLIAPSQSIPILQQLVILAYLAWLLSYGITVSANDNADAARKQ